MTIITQNYQTVNKTKFLLKWVKYGKSSVNVQHFACCQFAHSAYKCHYVQKQIATVMKHVSIAYTTFLGTLKGTTLTYHQYHVI